MPSLEKEWSATIRLLGYWWPDRYPLDQSLDLIVVDRQRTIVDKHIQCFPSLASPTRIALGDSGLLGVACYRYSDPMGHKPSKRISAVTNPIKPRMTERQ
jgi:hypothetical protein